MADLAILSPEATGLPHAAIGAERAAIGHVCAWDGLPIEAATSQRPTSRPGWGSGSRSSAPLSNER
jgi:hypothetical protein